MPTSLKQEIVRRYAVLCQALTQLTSKPPLPSPLWVDAADIVLLTTNYFGPLKKENQKADYRPAIKKLAAMRGISVTDEEIEQAYPLLHEYVDWLITQLRSRKV